MLRGVRAGFNQRLTLVETAVDAKGNTVTSAPFPTISTQTDGKENELVKDRKKFIQKWRSVKDFDRDGLLVT